MDHQTVAAYLERVGVPAPTVSDAAGLRTLHRAHLLTVPFENLSIHLAEPISLDERDLGLGSNGSVDEAPTRRRVSRRRPANPAPGWRDTIRRTHIPQVSSPASRYRRVAGPAGPRGVVTLRFIERSHVRLAAA